MTALPGTYDLETRQAQPFSRTFAYTDDDGNPVDLSGYEAYMPVRRQFHGGRFLFQLTTDTDGGITIDGPAGTITVSASATFMRDVATGSGYYDLVLVPGGEMEQKFALITGRFTIAQRVQPEGGNNG